MADLTLKDVQDFIEHNSDTQEVKDFLVTLQPKITPDVFKKLIEEDTDIKATHFSLIDSARSKGIESWKTNNLQKLVDEEVAKRNPKETEEQKQLRELREQFANLEKDKTKSSLLNTALKLAQEKQIPTDFIDKFVGNDEDETKQNIERFAKVFQDAVTASTQGKFKDFGRVPKTAENLSPTTITMAQIERMDDAELKRRATEINAFLETENKKMGE